MIILLRPENGAWNIEHYRGRSELLFSGTVAASENTVKYQVRKYRNYVITDGKDYPAGWDERWDITLTRHADGRYSGSTQYTWIESGYWDRDEQYTCTAILSQPVQI